MRLLKFDENGALRLTEDLVAEIPPYAILSHTWNADKDELSFDDVKEGTGKSKVDMPKFSSLESKPETIA
jgi:hypothetical protein